MQLDHPAAGTTNQAAHVRPAGLVWDRANRQVFADLSAAMLQPKPVVVLLGAPGSGKTALLNDWVADCSGAIYIARPGPIGGDVDSVMAAVGLAFGVQGDGPVASALRGKLTALVDRGEIPVLLIDDADQLDANTIELLRQFSTIRHNGVPLLRLVLAGRPALRTIARLDDARTEGTVTVLEMPTLDRDAAETLAGRVIREVTSGQAEIEIGVAAAVARHGVTTPGALRSAAEKIGKAARDGGWSRISADRAGQILDGGPAPTSMVPAAAIQSAPHPHGSVAPTVAFETPDNVPEPPAPKPAQDVSGDAAVLPKSIREAEDPRTLLRWAFGLKNGETPPGAQPVTPAQAEADPLPAPPPITPAAAPKAAPPQAAPPPQAAAPAEPTPAPEPAQTPPPPMPPAQSEAPSMPRMPRFGPPSQEALSGQLSARNRSTRHAMDTSSADEMRFPETDADLDAALSRVVAAERAERGGQQAKAAPPAAPAVPPQAAPLQRVPLPFAEAQPVPPPAEQPVPPPAQQPVPPQAAEPAPQPVQPASLEPAAPSAPQPEPPGFEPQAEMQPPATPFDEMLPAPETIGSTLGTTLDGGRIISADLPPIAMHRPDDVQERHDRFDANERFLKEAFALPEERSRSWNAVYFAGAFAAGLALAFVGWPMLRTALYTPGSTLGAEDGIAAITVGTANDTALNAGARTVAGSGEEGPALTAMIDGIKSPEVDERVVVSGFASLDGTGVRVPDQSFDPPVRTVASTPERLAGPDLGETPQIQPVIGTNPRGVVGDVEGLGSEEFAALVTAKAELEAEIRALSTRRDTIASEIPLLQQQAATLSGQSAQLDAALQATRLEMSAAKEQAQQDVDALSAEADALSLKIASAAAELNAREADLASKSAEISSLATEAEAAAARRDAVRGEVSSLEARRDEIAAAQALVANRDAVAAELAQMEAERATLAAELSASRDALAAQENALNALRAEAADLTAQRDATATAATRLQAEVESVRADLAEAEQARADAEAARDNALTAQNLSVEEIAAARGLAESELANVNGALQIGQAELAALEQTIADRRADLDAPLAEIAEAEAKVAALNDRSTTLETAIAAAEAQLNGLTNGQDVAANAAAEVTAEIERMTEARTLVKQDLDAARAELSQVEARSEAQRSELEAQLAALAQEVQTRQGEVNSAQSAADALELRLTELADQTAAEEARYAELQQQLERELQQSNGRLEAARAAADEETARLTAAISEVDAIEARRAEALAALEEAESSLAAAQGAQDARLSNEAQGLEAEIGAARERLAALTSDVAAQDTILTDSVAQKAALEAEIAALRSELGTLDQTAANQAASLADVTSERSALEAEIEGMREAMRTLAVDADAQVAAVAAAAAEKERLEREIAALRNELESNSTAEAERATALQDIASAQETLAALRADIAAAEEVRQTLEVDVVISPDEATPQQTVTPAEVVETVAPPARAGTQTRVTRDADDVREALVGLPELDKLDASQRARLEEELISGACLTEALEKSAGRINRLMLAGLMRKLEMCTG